MGPNPTDRGKNGNKRHLLVDGRGVPLSIVVTGANVNGGKRLDEALSAIQRDPTKKARRWVVEVTHSWFNRFRKLLVRYEKLERSFMALNHLAAASSAFRRMPLKINIIYG